MRSEIVYSLLLANSASAVAFPHARLHAKLAKRQWGGDFGTTPQFGEWTKIDNTAATNGDGPGRWIPFGSGGPSLGIDTPASVDTAAPPADRSKLTVEPVQKTVDTLTQDDTADNETAPQPASEPSPEPIAQPVVAPQEPQPEPQQSEPSNEPASTSDDSSSSSGDGCAPAPDAYASSALSTHNSLRAEHGAGPLCWDDRLAAAAKMLADTCVFGHNTALDGGNYGQNIAMGGGDVSNVIQNMWYSEGNPGPDGFNHFTQVVWKGTTKLGCATTNCPGNPYTVCNYDPAGNMMGAMAANVS